VENGGPKKRGPKEEIVEMDGIRMTRAEHAARLGISTRAFAARIRKARAMKQRER